MWNITVLALEIALDGVRIPIIANCIINNSVRVRVN